jgi:hypothetical protein
LGLRLNLSEQPEVALVAATHALSAQIFYLGADAHVVGIQPIKTDLAAYADGIEDAAAGKEWADLFGRSIGICPPIGADPKRRAGDRPDTNSL